MSTKTKKLPNCDDVDYVAPVTRVIVFLKEEVLLNKIVSKKARLREIFISGNLDPNGNYMMDGRPLDVNKTIFELLPKYADQLTDVRLIIHAIKLDLQEDNQEIYFDPVLKPFENPFRILVFSPAEFTTSFKRYPANTLRYYKLDNFSDSASAYCNTDKGLYISGGKNRGKGTKDFLKVCNLKLTIERLPDIPIKKESHSMVFVPKNYIYFVGGCSKDTFFYDTSSNLFGEWAPLKQEKISPALALVNNRYLYAFSEQKEKKKFDFIERTDLKQIPEWEKITVKVVEPFPMHNFGAAVGNDGRVYFLGGRRDKGEKIYCYNTLKNIIEPCGQENSSLKISDKTFYFLNEYNSALIPNELREDVQIVLFNRKKNKFRKVHYEKDLEETIDIKDMTNSSGKPEENRPLKVYCKKIPFGKMPQIPEKLIKFPKIEDLKGNLGANVSLNLPKPSLDLNINPDVKKDINIDIDVGGKMPSIPGEIDIQGPKVDLQAPNLQLRGKAPKINIGLPSFGFGKKSTATNVDYNPNLLRGILCAPVDDPINLNKKPYGLAKIKVNKMFFNKGKKKSIALSLNANLGLDKPHVKKMSTAAIDFRGPNIDLEIKKPGMDLRGPKLGLSTNMSLNGPKMDDEIDIRGPKIGVPSIDVKGPKLDAGIGMKGPKIGGGIDIDIAGPKIGGPSLDLRGPKIGGGIDINGPKIGGPTIDINGPKIGGGIGISGPGFGVPGIGLKGIITSADYDKNNLRAILNGDITDPIVIMKRPFNMPKFSLDLCGKGGLNINGPKIGLDVGIKGPKIGGGIDLSGRPIEINQPKIVCGVGMNAPKIGGGIDLDIKGPKIGGPSLDVRGPKIGGGIDIVGPKIGGPSIDINGPKIGGPSLDVKGPKIGGGLDIHGPRIGAPAIDIDINAPKIGGGLDIHGPRIGGPSLDIDVNAPKIGGGIDINGPKIGGPSLDIHGPKIGVPSLGRT